MTDIRVQLVHGLTAYDRKLAAKAQYNCYALGQYLSRIEDIMDDIGNGAEPRAAITAAFTGGVLKAALKACGLSNATSDELTGRGRMVYQRASKRNASNV